MFYCEYRYRELEKRGEDLSKVPSSPVIPCGDGRLTRVV